VPLVGFTIEIVIHICILLGTVLEIIVYVAFQSYYFDLMCFFLDFTFIC